MNKTKIKLLMKVTALTIVCVMISQFFPSIVFGVRQWNELQDEEIIITEETKQEEVEQEETKQEETEDKEVEQKETQQEEAEQEVAEEKKEIQQEATNNRTKLQIQATNEIIEKRTLNEKHFLQEDGTIVASVYPMNVHYNLNGKLEDINNSLEETNEDGGTLENKTNAFKVKFSKKSNKNNLVKLKINNNNIKWSLQNSNKVEAIKLNNSGEKEKGKFDLKDISSGTIKYENILDNIDVEYNIVSSQIKENIILKDKSAINQEITFEYNTDKLKMEKTENGRIILYEKNKDEIEFFLEVPYMYDAKGEISNDIDIELTNKNSKYTMTLKPNKEWLESPEREYPITIDPTVQTSLNYQNIEDTYIFDGDSGYPNRYISHILRVGSNNKIKSKGPSRSLIKFDLPQLNTGDQVIAAMLDICTYPDTNEWTPPSDNIQIDVHKMTQNWDSTSANWNDLNNKYDSRIVDYNKYRFDYNEQIKFYYFDITSIVKDWYVTGNNYGLVLKDHTEVYNAPHSDAYFYSSDVSSAYANARPMVQIVYRNQTGLETYQTYHTQSVGRAGTIYTNDYNGNLVLKHGDVSTPGNLMPVSVNHVYNTNYKDIDIGYGKGFRLNLSQTINLETISGVEYAKYIDEDGTAHYLKKEGSNTYKDEDGLSLTLTLESNSNFRMTDKEHNVLIFQKRENNNIGQMWHLIEAQDSYGNKITLELNGDNQSEFRIHKVTDAAGDSIDFMYDGARLCAMQDKNGRSIRITYNSNFNISEITYWDSKKSTYTYNSLNLLTSVKNIDNSRIEYEYYNEKANRVKSIKEYSTNGELGNTLNISYGDNVTKFTDNKGYSNTYTFNNSGQTISISDFGKNSSDIDNAYGKMYQYGERNK